MRETSAAVSAFHPSHAEWQQEVEMDRMMATFVKLAFALPAAMMALRLFTLAG